MSIFNNLTVRLFPQTQTSEVFSTSEQTGVGEALQHLAVTPAAPLLSAAIGHAVLRGQAEANVLQSQFMEPKIFGVMGDSTQFIGVHSKLGAHVAKGVKPFAFGFPTQGDAADYIASQINTSYNGPAVDQKVRKAVSDACTEWLPGQDLVRLVYDKVLAALKGVLPETKAPAGLPVMVPGADGLGDIFKQFNNSLPEGVNLSLPEALGGGQPRFDFPNSAQAVAYLAAKQIQANGSTVLGVLQHMLTSTPTAPR